MMLIYAQLLNFQERNIQNSGGGEEPDITSGLLIWTAALSCLIIYGE